MAGSNPTSNVWSSQGMPLPSFFHTIQRVGAEVDLLAHGRANLALPADCAQHTLATCDLHTGVSDARHDSSLALASIVAADATSVTPSLWYRDHEKSTSVIAYEGAGNLTAITKSTDDTDTIFIRTADYPSAETAKIGRMSFERKMEHKEGQLTLTDVAIEWAGNPYFKKPNAADPLHEFFPAALECAGIDPGDGEERALHQWIFYLALYLMELFPDEPAKICGRAGAGKKTLDPDKICFDDFESLFQGTNYATLSVSGATFVYDGAASTIRLHVHFGDREHNPDDFPRLITDLQFAYLRHLETVDQSITDVIL